MGTSRAVERIVVGVDGSEQAASALDSAIQLARALGAEVVAVYAIPPPVYFEYVYEVAPPVSFDPAWRAEMKREFEQEWCRALRESGVPYRTIIGDGHPAEIVAAVADREGADLVVVGRRGRGGIAEMVLGSVSHELSHRCRRPVLLISRAHAIGQKGPAAAETTQPV